MSDSKRSFFDAAHKPAKLWSKDSLRIDELKPHVVHEGCLLKYSKKKRVYEEKYFLLTAKALLYVKRKDSGQAFGALSLEWMRNYWKPINHEGKPAFMLIFTSNMKYSGFLVLSEADMWGWKHALSGICVQTDFFFTYNLTSVIGRGAFACVNLANERSTGKQFAVKVYNKALFEEESYYKASLCSEIQTLRRLRHPNIVRLKTVFESQTSVYLIQELVEGKNMTSLTQIKRVFSPQDIRLTLRTLLECLVYMERKGVVHRDIKPSNLMINESSDGLITRMTLVDFGFGTRISKAKANFVCGTPGYIAPELLKETPDSKLKYINSKIDVFSVGMVAYFMVHGEIPFKKIDRHKLLKQNKNCKVFFDTAELCDNTELKNVLKGMLEPNPDNRLSAKQALSHSYFNYKPDICVSDQEILCLPSNTQTKSGDKGRQLITQTKKTYAVLRDININPKLINHIKPPLQDLTTGSKGAINSGAF